MIREFIQKKSIQLLLLIMVAGIWLYNSWQIFSINTENEIIHRQEVLSLGVSEDLSLPFVGQFEYRGDFRDPFIPVLEKISNTEVDITHEPKETIPTPAPDLILTGIFENMAVIQDMYGDTHFVEQGDSIGELILTSIYSDSVTLFFDNKILSIKLH